MMTQCRGVKCVYNYNPNHLVDGGPLEEARRAATRLSFEREWRWLGVTYAHAAIAYTLIIFLAMGIVTFLAVESDSCGRRDKYRRSIRRDDWPAGDAQ